MKLSGEDWRKEYVRIYFIYYIISYIDIPLPTEVGRLELFKINLRGLALAEDIDWS